MKAVGIVLTIVKALSLVIAEGADVAEDRLPGSQLSVQAAAQKSRLVVIVKNVDMGLTDPDFPGKAYYSDVKVNIVKSLKGGVPKVLSSVGIMIQTLPLKAAEAAPDVNKDYIFFLEGVHPSTPRAVKILLANEENVRITIEALRTVEDRLPGSGMSVKEAATKSQVVIVGRVVALDLLDPTAPGRVHYDLKLEAEKILKGKAPELPVLLSVQSSPLNIAEATPKIGGKYLFFIEVPNPSQLWNVKVTRAGEDDLRAAEHAINAEKP